jgi:nucleotidyltransferase AbiEii toxin of type IV toxin-antitoxin system
MFRLAQHRSVLALLRDFDAEILDRCGFLFGGGTRIVLELEEYRVSQDVDFLCADASGYADLRLRVTERGYAGLFTPSGLERLTFPREIRVDQYGARFPVTCDGEALRVELIREARIGLDPGVRADWCPVRCLSIPDCFAEKLLANSDRWADRQLLSRDLIDLSAMRLRFGAIPNRAWEKAEAAYKAACLGDLEKALAAFAGAPEYQQRCFAGLRIAAPEAILDGMRQLQADLAS